MGRNRRCPAIPGRALRDVLRFAGDAGVKRLVLFGSRARGTNDPYSDVDLAVYGGDFDRFYWNVQEKTWSLLSFDLIDMQGKVAPELQEEIRRDGVVIYEKD
ncbi:MAG: nucleotidyltransferase family protein [Eubacterium sp.]